MAIKKRVRVWSYNPGSKSARGLADALGGKVLKHVGSKYVARAGDLVVNWGGGNVPPFGAATVLNKTTAIASNKLSAFRAFEAAEVAIPTFYTDRAAIPADAYPIVCRTILGGHSGACIVIANTPDELVDAPLYVKYVKKMDEYRVHVFKDGAFFVQRKARKHDVADNDVNWQVRNLANGFAFVMVEDIDTVPQSIINEAIRAVAACGLDFGGVDVIYNTKAAKAYVLEINTACGLEPRTAEAYKLEIEEFANNAPDA